MPLYSQKRRLQTRHGYSQFCLDSPGCVGTEGHSLRAYPEFLLSSLEKSYKITPVFLTYGKTRGQMISGFGSVGVATFRPARCQRRYSTVSSHAVPPVVVKGEPSHFTDGNTEVQEAISCPGVTETTAEPVIHSIPPPLSRWAVHRPMGSRGQAAPDPSCPG